MERGARRATSFTDVLGPDEYHEHVNNNVFTNRVAAWHLRFAADIADWLCQAQSGRARELLGDEAEAAAATTPSFAAWPT